MCIYTYLWLGRKSTILSKLSYWSYLTNLNLIFSKKYPISIFSIVTEIKITLNKYTYIHISLIIFRLPCITNIIMASQKPAKIGTFNPYCVVECIDGLTVILKTWFISTKKCYFPPYSSQSKINKMLLKKVDPDRKA